MELRLPSLCDVTEFFINNYRKGSIAYLIVNNGSVRFYSGSLTYLDDWFTDVSPNVCKALKDEIIIFPGNGYYKFNWNCEKWMKIINDSEPDDFINAEEVFFGANIKKTLKEIYEIVPVPYSEANTKINARESGLLLTGKVFIHDNQSNFKNRLSDSYLALFLQKDLDENYKKAQLKTFIKSEPFIFLNNVFDEEIFINPDEPKSPIIFGGESRFNSHPTAMIFPPIWSERNLF
ncbi:MAG: hypothetical protein NT052_01955 [Candidatus Shapirobacteria bacterium]|nr:hypothetical protein [Candidatus Shapirobacteria bacterium]